MSLAFIVREWRERDGCNASQVIPPTVKYLAAQAELSCGCGKCLACQLSRFTARVERIILKRDFNISKP